MIAQPNSFPGRAAGRLGAALLLASLAACSGGAPHASSTSVSERPTPEASPSVTVINLDAVIIPPEEPPPDMTLSDAGHGRAVLGTLPLSPDSAAGLLAVPGFVDGRWSRFAGPAEAFEASKGFILSWVAQYASTEDAGEAYAILLNELTSDEHYGWVGEDVGLGDESTCAEGNNPQMGGLHETICVWRLGPLVMVVGGGSENETPIQADAEAMHTRALALDADGQ